jgi:hypothetical protein
VVKHLVCCGCWGGGARSWLPSSQEMELDRFFLVGGVVFSVLVSEGVRGGVGWFLGPGSGLSEESAVGVEPAALDVSVAPICPPGSAFLASVSICW